MSSPTINAIGIVGILSVIPPFVFAFVANEPQRRRTRRLEAAGAEFGAEIQDEKPGLLRRFAPGQRAWLKRQTVAPAALPLLCWMFFVYFSSGLLPQFVAIDSATQPLALRVWWSYLSHICSNSMVYAVFALVAGQLATLELMNAARFFRTRPVSWRFLFVARVGAVCCTLVLSLVVAAGLSFALLLAVYGPAWKHLGDGAASAAIVARAQQQAGPAYDFMYEGLHPFAAHLTWSTQTSLPRLFLSIITTMLLGFSLFVAVSTVPIRGRIARIAFIAVTMYSVFLAYTTYVTIGSNLSPIFARGLFLYVHPGSPPDWVFALVPISISAALLIAAGFLNQRYEG